jgi:hypothetical protein
MDRIIYDIIDNNIIKLFDKATIFFPSFKYDVNTNIEAIVKFLLYSSIIILLLTNNWKLLVVIIIFTIIFKIFTHNSISLAYDEINKKNDIKYKCRKSTIDNPTGNVLLYTPNTELDKKFCPNQDKEMDKNIKYNYYYNSSDLFQTKNNMRSFITMPSQTHPNNIDNFKSYLYNFEVPNCKYDSVNCMFNNDLRYHKNTFLDK